MPPQVLEILAEANTGYAKSYGADSMMEEVEERLRALFEAPNAKVYLVPTGTTANVLALASICQPYQTIFCSSVAHIHEDECNAPEFFTGGAKLTLVAGNDRITPADLRTSIETQGNRGVHGPMRGPVSLTNVTEYGNIYTVEQTKALCAVAKEYGLPVHLDGARFANAVTALGCKPAELSWKAGIDVLCFGGTKNGLMGVEAVIFFNPDLAHSFEHRRKRAGHLFSKHRYLSAQMAAYLRDDLWQDLAQKANANCAHLRRGLSANNRVTIENDPGSNMLFPTYPRAWHQRAIDAGAQYHMWGKSTLAGTDPDEMLSCRLVTDWAISHSEIDRFLDVTLNG